jgi:RHS repeat-associated protein
VVFANDNQEGGEETDLFIDYIKVNGVTFQAESEDTDYDRGTYPSGCFDGIDVVDGQEQMDVEGALRFTVTGAQPLSRTIIYGKDNTIESITENGSTSTFYYDAGGQRVKKTENGVHTYYFFSNYEEVVNGSDTAAVIYYFANNQRIAQRTVTATENELLYVHTDHLGSAVRLTDDTGQPVQSIAYDPYGRTVFYAGTKGFAYRFTDQEYDAGSALYYYDARYYDPMLGRFIQADTVLDGLNRYAYCGNNPVMYTDPSGEFLTFKIGPDGFSIGINLAPIGIGWGCGINIGWGGGEFSLGGYTEVGYRALCFDGGTAQVGFNYGFGETGLSVYASLSAGLYYGTIGFGVSDSTSYNFGNGASMGWSGLTLGLDLGNIISAGGSLTFFGNIGFGWELHLGLQNNAFESGGWELGATIGYGSIGFTWGINARYTQNPFEEYNEIEGMTVCRIEPFGEEDKFGHYWIEFEDESYGFWPEDRVSVADALTNAQEGEINGVSNFGGNLTRDPHHGDSGRNIIRYKVYGTKSKEFYLNSLRRHEFYYKGQYGSPFGKTCQTFQRSFLFKTGLKIRR